MYYYAYIDENNIVQGVYAMPSPIPVASYIQIDSYDESLIGKRYNAETGLFEEVVNIYYYARLNDRDIVIEVLTVEDTPLAEANDIIPITSADVTLINKTYNRETQQFDDTPISVLAKHSTNEINVGNADKWLSTVIAELEAAKHTHTNKAVLDGITAAMVAAWNSGTSGADGEDGVTFTPSVSAAGVISWTNNGGLANPAPVNIKGADGKDGTNGTNGTNGVSPTVSIAKNGTVTTITITDVNGTHTATINDGTNGESGTTISAAEILAKLKTVDGQNSELDADLLDGHNSDYFATAEQLTGKANTEHTHDYATSDHTHTGYAAENHSHSDYITATTYANGMNGKADTNHSHSGYASSSHTHSDYFPTSGGTITGETNFSGGLVRLKGAQTLFHSGSQLVFGSNNLSTRIAGNAISATKTITVDSDERLKENIAAVDENACAELINSIDVKTFNYIGEETECIGVIAQELQAANPELAKYLVSENADGYLSVKVADLVFPLIATVQELTRRVNTLESK